MQAASFLPVCSLNIDTFNWKAESCHLEDYIDDAQKMPLKLLR